MKKYILSDTLTGVLEKVGIAEMNYVHKMLLHYINEYKKQKKENPTKGKSIAYGIQSIVQEGIDKKIVEEKAKGTNISCRNGCSFCCFLNVDITDDEADLIVDYAKGTGIKLDKARLDLQSKAKDYDKLPIKDRKCVLLDDKGSCMAYKVRPNACRKLVVATDPANCDTDKNLGKKVARLFDVEVEVITSSTLNATTNGRLSEMLLKSMNNDSK